MKGFKPLILAAASAVAVFAYSEDPADKAKTQPAQSKPAAKPPASAPKAGPVRPSGGGGMVVVVDPATGQIREATAAEIGAVGALSPNVPISENQLTSSITPVGQPGPGGSVILTLDGSTDTYSVMTVGPDGKLSMDCVTGEAAAAKRLGATAQKKQESKNEK